MSRIVLHIGTHKTATTTVQRGMANTRKTLAERGIFYPDYDLIGEGSHYAHLGIVNAFSKAHPKLSRAQAEEFFARVAQRATDYDVTILSAEPFFRHVGFGADGTPMKTPGRPENYWPARRRYIEDVAEQFSGAQVQIDVAMVVRRQADYGLSLYQEHVKTSRYRGTFHQFRQEYWHRFDYLRQARMWRDVFGGLRLARFEDLVAQDNVLEAFGLEIGVDLGGLPAPPKENSGLVPDLVIWKRIANGASKKEAVLRKQIAAFAQALDGPVLQHLTKRSLYDDARDMCGFQAGFDDANQLLQHEFMPHTVEQGPMFSDQFPTDLKYGDAFDPDFLSALSAHVIDGA